MVDWPKLMSPGNSSEKTKRCLGVFISNYHLKSFCMCLWKGGNISFVSSPVIIRILQVNGIRYILVAVTAALLVLVTRTCTRLLQPAKAVLEVGRRGRNRNTRSARAPARYSDWRLLLPPHSTQHL